MEMLWPLNLSLGLLVLILGFKPDWFSKDLQKQFSRRPQYVTVLKWCGAIAVAVSLLGLLGIL